MLRPIRGAELVADQAIDGLGVGDAQERLGEAHEHDPLLGGERVFVQEGVETAFAEALPAHFDDEAAGALGDAVEGVGREFRGGEQPLHHRRLVLAIGREDRRPERRWRNGRFAIDDAHLRASAERVVGTEKPSRSGSSASITKLDVPE